MPMFAILELNAANNNDDDEKQIFFQRNLNK